MKKTLAVCCLLLWGCTKPPNQKVKEFETITDEAGNNQLVLQFVQRDFPMKGEGRAYDFHSLDWEIKDGAKWVRKVAISRDDFQKGCQRRRWVSKLQSFEPTTGRAILRIGEDGLLDAAGDTHVTYTWREWDVLKNQEVRVIRVCQDPFESFE
jgi:hypothetical protein